MLERCPVCKCQLEGLPVVHNCPECGYPCDKRAFAIHEQSWLGFIAASLGGWFITHSVLRAYFDPYEFTALSLVAGIVLLCIAAAQYRRRWFLLVTPDEVPIYRTGRPERRVSLQGVRDVRSEGKDILLLTDTEPLRLSDRILRDRVNRRRTLCFMSGLLAAPNEIENRVQGVGLTPRSTTDMLPSMRTLSTKSHAKINLTLRVGPLRADGFHPIESLVAQVELHDTVTVSVGGEPGVTLVCDDPAVPTDESNLAIVAARRLAEAASVDVGGVRIAIEKRIPMGGGLGGGSSNAAATLRLLNELWGLGWSPEQLAEVGAGIGSDVPLFLHGPLTAVRGRGEIVRTVDRKLDAFVVLVFPEIHCETRAVYAAFDQSPERTARPELEKIIASLPEVDAMTPQLFNDLEFPAALATSLALRQFQDQLVRETPSTFHMTGSGSTFFAIRKDKPAADELATWVRGACPGAGCVVTRFL